MKKFRIGYTAQNGEKSIIDHSDRYLIGLDGTVYENYGNDWDAPMWEEIFDAAAPPIVQQYTGCKDKNQKEIWEGDIVNYNINWERRGTIVFFAGSFVVDWGDQTDSELSVLLWANLEVIGNVFLGMKCDCYLVKNQVCNICQNITGKEKDVCEEKEKE